MINIPKIDIFYSIKEKNRSEIKIKGSKFIATAIPINNLDEFQENLNKIRKEFYDATHNCFAYKLKLDINYEGYSDDGEPNGSAGKPIFFIINKYELTNLLVVVTRYFGGTKLGVGGLVRAYSDATEEVLKISEKKEIIITNKFKLQCQYSELSTVKKILEKYAVKHLEYFTDIIIIEVEVPNSLSEEFKETLYQTMNGKNIIID